MKMQFGDFDHLKNMKLNDALMEGIIMEAMVADNAKFRKGLFG